jgi:Flp pilus assembly protein TadG
MSFNSTGDAMAKGTIISRLRVFHRGSSGAALVEFMLILPLSILFFGLIIEFGRLYWGYQATVAGVRDASRYLARVADIEICLNAGSLNQYEATLKTMIEKDVSGNSVLPVQFTVDSVDASYACETATGGAPAYRTSPMPVATVDATVTMQFPLGRSFSLFGSSYTSITTHVVDEARIFGQ